MIRKAVSRALLPAAVIAVVAIAVITGWQERAPPAVAAALAAPAFVNETSCQGCHAPQFEDWLGSHHQRAMQPATSETVLADFNDQSLTSDVETTRFFRRDGEFWINTSNERGEPQDYRVAYTFGVAPLQQYLIELADGRLQAHPAAWDVTAQRWFHLYDGMAVNAAHPLHWTGPQQNADFMCIECHTTGFRRDYDAATHGFDSQWQALGVGCQGCHGPASNHLEWANGALEDAARGFEQPLLRTGNAGEPETCARCHSRRTPLGNGYQHGNMLLDDYLPMILSADLYEVDGKIKDEVFEYGSFQQSRMHAAGVVCSDCHNPHSTELRAPGNAVCTQCHNPNATPRRSGIEASGLLAKNYDDPAHHHHPQGSAGSQCTSCHMPGKTYMGNDLRRDHSFTSPNPIEARALGHSDACLGCHADGSEDELAGAFTQWYPQAAPRDGGYARDLHAARNGLPGAAEGLLRQLARSDIADIRRATLLSELVNYPSVAAQRAVVEALGHASPLVRRTAIELLPALLPPQHQATLYQSFRNDPVRAVRLAVAWQWLQLEDGNVDARLLEEYERAQNSMLDRAESHYNLAGLYQLTGWQAEVEPALLRALQRDPAFQPARIMLAQWREQVMNDAEGALTLLQEGIARYPQDASLQQAYGLMLVRRGQGEDALQAFRRAHELAPGQPDYAYLHAVALHGSGAQDEAIAMLRETLEKHPANRQLRVALISYLHAAGRQEEIRPLLAVLAEQNPGDPLLQQGRRTQ
ncbi:MAG TPA: multiheme c-type cytochrome [Gammaproteobacteria bacterium]|nr:multiheme c-type cytochrome [Gammaproteobacteria bacterium]